MMLLDPSRTAVFFPPDAVACRERVVRALIDGEPVPQGEGGSAAWIAPIAPGTYRINYETVLEFAFERRDEAGNVTREWVAWEG